jgi:predicted DNA-binding ribbon-helix-helix protein
MTRRAVPSREKSRETQGVGGEWAAQSSPLDPLMTLSDHSREVRLGRQMIFELVKRSVIINKHRTSVSLEEPFWEALTEIAEAAGKSKSTLVTEIDKARAGRGNLSSATRMFVLEHYRSELAAMKVKTG